MTLREFVKKTRVKNNQTHSSLARAGGLGSALISAIETGRARYINRADIPKLAQGLGIPEAELWACLPAGQQEGGSRYIKVEE